MLTTDKKKKNGNRNILTSMYISIHRYGKSFMKNISVVAFQPNINRYLNVPLQ